MAGGRQQMPAHPLGCLEQLAFSFARVHISLAVTKTVGGAY